MFGTYKCKLDNGTEHKVTIDNRDFIAFRRRGYRELGLPSPDVMSSVMSKISENGATAIDGLEAIELIAWMLYNAGGRVDAWDTASLTYESFVERECVSFELAEDADAPRPTQAGSAATSPS